MEPRDPSKAPDSTAAFFGAQVPEKRCGQGSEVPSERITALCPTSKGAGARGASQGIPGPHRCLVALVQLLARSAARDELDIEPSGDGAGASEALGGLPSPVTGYFDREESDG
jgi:hypothetical protein